MTAALAWTVALLLALAMVVGLAYLQLRRGAFNQRLAEFLARKASEALGVPVELTITNIEPLSGYVRLEGVAVANPQGWGRPYALACPELEIRVRPATLFRAVAVIEEVRVTHPEIDFESGREENNLKALARLVQGSGRTTPKGSGSSRRPSLPLARRLVVDRFLLTGGTVRLGLTALGPNRLTVPFPDLELAALGRAEGGLDPAGLMSAALRATIDRALNVAAGAVERAALGAAKGIGNALMGWITGRREGR